MTSVNNVFAGTVKEPLAPGSCVYFGLHSRRWRILEVDVLLNRMLVISDECIGEKAHAEHKDAGWHNSNIRNWLVNDCRRKEFLPEESKGILLTHIRARGSKAVEDHMFLLSEEEYMRYKAYIPNTHGISWWLRDRCKNWKDFFLCVDTEGNVTEEWQWHAFGIRPAMWVNLSSPALQKQMERNAQGEVCVAGPLMVIENNELIYVREICTDVTIPSTVTKIRRHAFCHCHQLEHIHWEGNAPVLEDNSIVDCPRLQLPKEFYIGKTLPSDQYASYMPIDHDILSNLLLNTHEKSAYRDILIQNLGADNAAELFDRVFPVLKERRDTDSGELILRYGLAAAPVLGRQRLRDIQKYLLLIRYNRFQWQPCFVREMERTDRLPLIGRDILRRNIVTYDLLSREWSELDRLHGLAEVIAAVGEYAMQYKIASVDASRTGKKHAYRKDPAAEAACAQLDHGALMMLLRKWAQWISPRWYVPYAAYANDMELDVLLAETKKADVSLVKDAYLLNDTIIAMRHADKMDTLGKYAEIRNMDEDTIRDQIISDFGLDEAGHRTWTLAGRTYTASINKDLTVTLTNDRGKPCRYISKKGAELIDYERTRHEIIDLKQGIHETAKVRNDRLFQDFLSGRERKAEDWKNAYLKKPVLRIMAELIVWQQDDASFILRDGQPIQADETTYTITDAPIVVAHPMEMGQEMTRSWQKYFTAHGLKQPFEQVWEPVENPENIRSDRYEGHPIAMYLLMNKQKHGITLDGLDVIRLKGCTAKLQSAASVPFYGSFTDEFEILNFHYDTYDRQVNHIVTYLDRCTVAGRVKQDDITAVQWLDYFTLAQITEFIRLAAEANAHNVLAQLMDYKNSHFEDIDPMDEFTLDL
ncbi:MAG: DUF4132 domain-containing protein [Solobacterium sp.]|nr:DUF4132 domain-containing protein [Solobacterium sp.]